MAEKTGKILVCDDSILARHQLVDIIKSYGDFEVMEAENGERAVECYKFFKPDIVFLDIVMPKKDGITATKEIIEIDPDAKVVMASSIGNKKNLKESLIAGAKEFVQKPIDFSQVTKIIEALLKGGN